MTCGPMPFLQDADQQSCGKRMAGSPRLFPVKSCQPDVPVFFGSGGLFRHGLSLFFAVPGLEQWKFPAVLSSDLVLPYGSLAVMYFQVIRGNLKEIRPPRRKPAATGHCDGQVASSGREAGFIRQAFNHAGRAA